MSSMNPPARSKKRASAKTGTQRRTAGWRSILTRKVLRRGGAGLGAASLLLGGVLLWESGVPQRGWDELRVEVMEQSAEAGMALQDLLVVGRNRTSQAELLAALDVRQGQPILAYDLADLRDRLAALPWVAEASVGRRLPGSLVIELREREPLALWQNRGKVTLIDRNGEAVPVRDLRQFAALPLIVGPDAPGHAGQLVRLLDSEPDLGRLVTAAVRVGGRRWNLRLLGDIDVQLPESGEKAAYSQLARLAREHGLLERDVRIIDLRLPDRMILHGIPGGIEGEQDSKPGQAT